jgi:tRNA pseudouridine55 synthase
MKPNYTNSGWLLVYKPEGIESFGIVRKLKFKYKFNKIGFAGTLDPLASGLLLIGINKATKSIPLIHQEKKAYEVQIYFGASTPTLDGEGRFENMKTPSHQLYERINHLKKFIGKYQQKIPNFSAHKIEGKNMYELARNNTAIEMKHKPVCVSALTILYSKLMTMGVHIECNTGFYVRAFAEELAKSLGDCAYASFIKRLKIGNFELSQSVEYEKILDFSTIHDLDSHLISI